MSGAGSNRRLIFYTSLQRTSEGLSSLWVRAPIEHVGVLPIIVFQLKYTVLLLPIEKDGRHFQYMSLIPV